MRCKKCDYLLWNLKARSCPECGTAFVPSAFEFVPGTVRFACPQCDQGYFGTDERGLLVPRKFACVRCASEIDIDAMVLAPAEGLTEEQTRARVNPWMERRKIGRWLGFWKTVWMGITGPSRLARATPPEGAAAASIRFALIVLLIPVLLGLTVFGLFALVAGGIRAFGPLGVGLAMIAAVMAVFLLLWVALAHLALRLTGKTKYTMGRTCAAVCFAAGPMVFGAVPCLGPYMSVPALIWWGIAAGIAISIMQKVSGWRAAIAGALGPLMVFTVVIGFYAVLIGAAFSGRLGATRVVAGGALVGAPTPPSVSSEAGNAQARKITDALRAHALAGDGRGPRHAAELIMTAVLAPPDFIAPGSARDIGSTPLGPITLGQFWVTGTAGQRAAVDAAATAVAPGAAGYWLGDYYICDRGVDYGAVDPGVWLVVGVARPAEGTKAEHFVVTTERGVRELSASTWAAELARQNELRAAAGLAELPDVLAR